MVGTASLYTGIWTGQHNAVLCGCTCRLDCPEFDSARCFLRVGFLPIPITFLARDGALLHTLCSGFLSGYTSILAKRGRGMAALPAIDGRDDDRGSGHRKASERGRAS